MNALITRRTRATARVFAALAIGALALSACGGSDGDSTDVADAPKFAAGSTMAKLADAGKLTVGTKFDQPGFGLKGLDGKPEGFDVEVAKIIAAKLGIDEDKITYKETPSAIREEVIEKGEVDLVAATYTINDLRKQRITFAGPYYEAGQQIMVKADNTTITGPDTLKGQADAKVCSVAGSTPAENIKKYLANDGQLVTFDVYSKCADALRTGQVAAVTTDNVILLGLVGKSEGAFKVVGETFTKEPYGIGIKKGDTAFCTFINDTLKAAAADGSYEKAWTSTAGKVEGSTVPTLPTADACA
jgi:glutamate transport system substrate-binding protein